MHHIENILLRYRITITYILLQGYDNLKLVNSALRMPMYVCMSWICRNPNAYVRNNHGTYVKP